MMSGFRACGQDLGAPARNLEHVLGIKPGPLGLVAYGRHGFIIDQPGPDVIKVLAGLLNLWLFSWPGCVRTILPPARPQQFL